MDVGGGAAVSHALHVLRCGALISVHAEQAHGSVCLGGGLGAGLVGLAGGCDVGLAGLGGGGCGVGLAGLGGGCGVGLAGLAGGCGVGCDGGGCGAGAGIAGAFGAPPLPVRFPFKSRMTSTVSVCRHCTLMSWFPASKKSTTSKHIFGGKRISFSPG